MKQGDTLPPNVGDPHGGPSPWPWAVPLFSGVKPTKAVLRDHFDPLFPDFNTDYPDQLRADEFLNEFGAFVRRARTKRAPTSKCLRSSCSTCRTITPEARGPIGRARLPHVADNDLALGRVVDAVSHSPYWDDTAIFVLEDDAQDGADHVDAHRSIAFVDQQIFAGIGGAAERGTSLLHNREYDSHHGDVARASAHEPERRLCSSDGRTVLRTGRSRPYQADYRNLKNGLIYETNKREAPGSTDFIAHGFSRPDAAGADRLNRVLWQDQKGSMPVPTAKHTVFPAGGD